MPGQIMGYLQLKSDVMRVRTAAADMICMSARGSRYNMAADCRKVRAQRYLKDIKCQSVSRLALLTKC